MLRRCLVPAVLASALAFSSSAALAQSTAPTPTPADPAPKAPASKDPGPKDTAPKEPAPKDTAKEEEARMHFAAGVNLVRDPARPRYEEAYAEFQKAYALTSAPKILGNIGLCAMKLERDSEAIDAYTRFLAEVTDMTPDERLQVERDLTTLRATVANVTLESRPPGALIRDTRVPNQGDSVTNTYGPLGGPTSLGLRRGHHVIKAVFPDGREVLWTADLNGGESHVFEAPAAAPPAPIEPAPVTTTPAAAERAGPRPIPTSVFVAGGATVTLLGASVVTGILSLGKQSDYEALNDGSDVARATAVRDDGVALGLASDILLVGAVVGAGVTTYLFLTRPGAREPRAEPAKTTGARRALGERGVDRVAPFRWQF